MAVNNNLVANHFTANSISTRWDCDWQVLSNIKSAIKTHNGKVDAYNQGDLPDFEIIQSAITIAMTLNSLIDTECHNPLLESPLFIGQHQGGTLVNIHYEQRNKDEILEWLNNTCENKYSLLANSIIDADILEDKKPLQSAEVALASNKFDFQGMVEFKTMPIMSVKFEFEKDAEIFHVKWHVS